MKTFTTECLKCGGGTGQDKPCNCAVVCTKLVPTREDYELAAKAAGIKVIWIESAKSMNLYDHSAAWQPITDKSDSFDLMVACGIEPKFWVDSIDACIGDTVLTKVYRKDFVTEADATMAAILLGAVEIGRNL